MLNRCQRAYGPPARSAHRCSPAVSLAIADRRPRVPMGVDAPQPSPHLQVGAARRGADRKHLVGQLAQFLDVVWTTSDQLASGQRVDPHIGIADLGRSPECVGAGPVGLVVQPEVAWPTGSAGPVTGLGWGRHVPGQPTPPGTRRGYLRPTPALRRLQGERGARQQVVGTRDVVPPRRPWHRHRGPRRDDRCEARRLRGPEGDGRGRPRAGRRRGPVRPDRAVRPPRTRASASPRPPPGVPTSSPRLMPHLPPRLPSGTRAPRGGRPRGARRPPRALRQRVGADRYARLRAVATRRSRGTGRGETPPPLADTGSMIPTRTASSTASRHVAGSQAERAGQVADAKASTEDRGSAQHAA